MTMTKQDILMAKSLIEKIKKLPRNRKYQEESENQEYPCVSHGCDGYGGYPSYWIFVYLDADCKGIEIAGERP